MHVPNVKNGCLLVTVYRKKVVRGGKFDALRIKLECFFSIYWLHALNSKSALRNIRALDLLFVRNEYPIDLVVSNFKKLKEPLLFLIGKYGHLLPIWRKLDECKIT